MLPMPPIVSKAVLTSFSSCAARSKVMAANKASHSASSTSLEPKWGGRRRSVTPTVARLIAAANRQ